MTIFNEWEATQRHAQMVRDAERRTRWNLDRLPAESSVWKALTSLFARDLPVGEAAVYSDDVPPKPVRKSA
jgi:hypothetical protein